MPFLICGIITVTQPSDKYCKMTHSYPPNLTIPNPNYTVKINVKNINEKPKT